MSAHKCVSCVSLSFASSNGHPECLITLIKSGCGLFINLSDEYGDTPLHEATIRGHKDCVRILLENGANPVLANRNRLTALDYARLSKSKEKDEIQGLIESYMYFDVKEPEQ